MKGSEAVVQQGWIQKEDWVLDMEPTSGMIQMAHKGRTWFELSVEGITAHASMPEKGAGAIAGIAFMIAELLKGFFIIFLNCENIIGLIEFCLFP